MAHILKRPSEEQKGIIIFTHKEALFFMNLFGSSILKKIKRKLNKSKSLSSQFSKQFNELHRRYVIGIHYGWHTPEIYNDPNFQFHKGSEGTINLSQHQNTIPLNSRNFTSTIFQDKKYNEKYWDIICVSRTAKFKNLGKFSISIKEAMKINTKLKTLLVIPFSANEHNKDKFDTELYDDYNRSFSEQEKENFTILKLHEEMSMFGVSKTQLSEWYNRSKTFTLFSELEGESRVIAEAQCCGLPVVVFKNLQGGGRDFLNDSNSLQFESYNKAHLTLLEAVETHNSLSPSQETINSLNEKHSVNNLINHFKRVFNNLNLPFDKTLSDTDNLARKLPGHYLDVPWKLSNTKTADIISKKQFDIFLRDAKK